MSCCWADETISLIRVLIYDLDPDSQRYSDARLKQVAIVAAQMLVTDVSFDTSYSVNFRSQVITPDPCDPDTRDDDFVNLTALKSACIISKAEAREAASAGFSVQDAINKFSSTDKVKGMLELAKSGYCKEYEDAKYNFAIAGTLIGHAILSPFNTGYNSIYRTRETGR